MHPNPRLFKFSPQLDADDCVLACMCMLGSCFGRSWSMGFVRGLASGGSQRGGISGNRIKSLAEGLGIRGFWVQLGLELGVTETKSLLEAPLPVLLVFGGDHAVVLLERRSKGFKIANPAVGVHWVSEAEMAEKWLFQGGGWCFLVEDSAPVSEPSVAWASSLKTQWQAFKPSNGQLFFFVGAMLASVFCFAAIPYYLRHTVDTLLTGRFWEFPTLIVLGYLALIVGFGLTEWFKGSLALKIGFKMQQRMTLSFWHRLIGLPINKIAERKEAAWLTRVNDIVRLEQFWISAMPATLLQTAVLCIAFGLVFTYYQPVAWLVLFFSGVYVLAFRYNLRSRSHKEHDRHAKQVNYQQQQWQLLRNITDIKLLDPDMKSVESLNLLQKQWHQGFYRFLQHDRAFELGLQLVNELRNLFALLLSAQAVTSGAISLGEMIVIQFALGQISGPIRQLIVFQKSYQDAQISYQRLFDMGFFEPSSATPTERFPTPPPQQIDSIEIKNLNYSYGVDCQTIKFQDNLFSKGQVHVLVGPNGGGKTTLLKQLAALLDCQTESIVINNQFDLSQIAPGAWQQQLTALLPESRPVGSTLLDAIIFPETSVNSPAQLAAALRNSQLIHWINTLPQGINTKLSGGGTDSATLSLGQRQKLLLARSFYLNSPHKLLILDEPFNHLDASSKTTVAKYLNKLAENQLVIISSHELPPNMEASLFEV